MADDIPQVVTPAEDAPALPEATAEPVESSTTTDEAPVTEPADDAGKPEPKGVGKRIDELTRNWRQTERDRDYWREMAIRAQQQPEKAPEAPKPEPPAKVPSLADYEYDEGKYQAALIEYTRAEARREAEAVLQAERERQANEARAKSWSEREAEYVKATPDYREKVTDPTLPITGAMARVIQASEIGPEVAYYLASNRDLAAQIAALSGDAAAHAIGRIEGRLLAQKEAKAAPAAKPVVSQAPPPPPKIEAVEPDVSKNPYDDSMSINEWFAWRNKDEQRRRRK